MRFFLLPILLLLAFPADAAEQTRVFPLRHRTAGEINQQLVDSWLLAAPSPGLMPAGISAWAVDDGQNALVATGSAEALTQLTAVLSHLDVRVPRLRLAIRSVRREDVTGRGVALEAATKTGLAVREGLMSEIEWAVLTPPQGKALLAGPAVTATEMTVTHNRPLHVRWPGQTTQPATLTSVVPRLNLDGTVTLLVSANSRQLEVGGGEERSPLPSIVFRRLPVGSALVLLPKDPGEGLMIQVRDGLP